MNNRKYIYIYPAESFCFAENDWNFLDKGNSRNSSVISLKKNNVELYVITQLML